jgi:hypothetical protein
MADWLIVILCVGITGAGIVLCVHEIAAAMRDAE